MSNITITAAGAITLKQGTTAEWRYQLNDSLGDAIDITFWSCACQVRKGYDGSSPILTPVVTVTDPLTGTFILSVSPEMSSAVRFTGECLECVYDVEVTDDNGGVTRIAEGTFIITREVTR